MSTPNNLLEKKISEPTPSFAPEQARTQEESEFAIEKAAFEQYAVQEHPLQKEDEFLDENIANLNQELKQQPSAKPTQVAKVRDDMTVRIEHIMEDGLVDAFKEMTAVQQQEFKIKGEQTAIEIRRLMSQSKIKVKKIFQLIIEWLRLIPGVNRYFIEQEAKIKADKIFALRLQDID